jgi:hypothetical protein
MTKILKKKEKGMNRHWKNFLDKDYLGSHNLEKDEEMILTIEKFVGDEGVMNKESGTKVPKQVLYFKENVPKMIMNITNGNIISALYGSHPEQWIGKKIQIFATQVKAFGKLQDALRVRDVKPKEDVDVTEALAKINATKTKEELRQCYLSLSEAERNNVQVVKLANNIKKKYENTQS